MCVAASGGHCGSEKVIGAIADVRIVLGHALALRSMLEHQVGPWIDLINAELAWF